MCGISGVIGSEGRESLRRTIKKINDAMSHRGPDADGFFVEDTIALGHRRLSILDLSTAANQPFADASGRYVMVFNGEIYNFQDIRQKLPDYPFVTSGDTEVVIAAYAKWGKDSIRLLKGMFALAIWDRKDNSVFMVRDRFGVKPMYYYHQDDQLIFASEIRAILASGKVPKKINKRAIIDYLKYQSFVSPYTPVEGVYQLPAGTSMTFRNGRISQEVYWDITQQRHQETETDISTVHTRIRDLLYQSVERRLVSDVPLGAFLSGGIDSSLVVAIMSQVNRKATNAFTIGFEEKEFDELPYAELVAKKFGVNHSKVMLRPSDFLDSLPAAMDAMDCPSGDGLNTYVVSKAIKANGITVALSGIGGDELFAGYPFFKTFSSLKKWGGVFDASRWLRRAGSSLIPQSDQKMGRIKGLLGASSSHIADVYPAFRQIQDEYTLNRLLTREAFAAGGGHTLEEQLREKEGNIDDFDVLSQVSIAEYMGYTQSVLLKDADQMGMAASLEIREPFFDHDLVEYALNVPDKFKYPEYPKKLLVESLKGLLPDEVVHRKKQGFVIPYNIWMKNDLRKFCGDRIERLADRGFFHAHQLRQYWADYLQGKNHIRYADVWIFVVLEHWLEQNQVA
ncbi:MAG TPA: asparagine synthase (glutamine-hydrolyzing) [Puia sp.]|nr:asparagine synthase (glutamine-hydrolyzing) [Puia sp.]